MDGKTTISVSPSAVVERKKIVDLTLVGRNVLSLAALQPGIKGVGTTADFLVPEQGMGVTANGVRETGNNAMVDGASINNGPWDGTMIVPGRVSAGAPTLRQGLVGPGCLHLRRQQ